VRAADLTDEARTAALGTWDRRGGGARRGRGTLYRNRALEVVFTIAPPWLPYVVMGPVALAMVTDGVLWLEGERSAGMLALGALTWSLVEYAMHRFLFHAPAEREAARVVLFLVHGHHHEWPDDPRRVAATPIQFGSLALLLYGVFSLALPEMDAHAAFGGAMLAYLAYEAVHFYAHHGRAQRGALGALRRYHMRHHHEDPRSRWGIGSPLWDVVFRTTGAAR
jgi:sterol desaturase/sphingolipid hydroxylase (fatty acid hydroxylase superfamily)